MTGSRFARARGTLEVTASFVLGKPQRFKSSDVSQIDVKLNGGNDVAEVAREVATPVAMSGGAGNDTLRGGAGNDLLLGDSGRDELYAGPGHNLLIGGADSDQLNGDLKGTHHPAGWRRAHQLASQSDNILIGGQTSYDTNNAALQIIMAEWTSARRFAVRVRNLNSGVGPNQAYAPNRGDTVLDDLTADILRSGSATAWALTSPGDRLIGRANTEE